jgi:two-component system NarL family sensor kinase
MRRYRRLSVVARALVQHAAISLVALVIVGAGAAIICVRLVQSEALRRAETSGQAIADRVVAPLVEQGVWDGDPTAINALDLRVRLRISGDTIQRVKVWSADGTILYCDDHEQIGLNFPLDPADKAVLDNGGVDSDISDLAKSENLFDRKFGQSLEVYAGARDTRGRPILVETYFTADQLHADEAALIRRITPVVVIAVLILGLLLVPLAFNLARRVARYERERQAMIRLAVEASSAERRRVAGELHDGVIQDLAGVGYALTALDGQIAGLGDASSAPGIGAVLDTLRTARRLVHDDVLALRELTGMHYAAASGAADPTAALRVIAEDARAGGVTVDLIIQELPPLPATHRAAIIRVGREALRNAAKHARGSHVLLSLDTEDDMVVLTVSDDGPGFDLNSALGPVEGHIGLALLADAAEGVGGRLDLRSRPGRGTTVTLSVPVPGNAGDRSAPRIDPPAIVSRPSPDQTSQRA